MERQRVKTEKIKVSAIYDVQVSVWIVGRDVDRPPAVGLTLSAGGQKIRVVFEDTSALLDFSLKVSKLIKGFVEENGDTYYKWIEEWIERKKAVMQRVEKTKDKIGDDKPF